MCLPVMPAVAGATAMVVRYFDAVRTASLDSALSVSISRPGDSDHAELTPLFRQRTKRGENRFVDVRPLIGE